MCRFASMNHNIYIVADPAPVNIACGPTMFTHNDPPSSLKATIPKTRLRVSIAKESGVVRVLIAIS